MKVYLTEINSDQADATDSENLLSIQRLEAFVKGMKDEKQYKPTTIAEKLRRIKLAIKCLIRFNDNQELYYRGKRVIDYIDQLCSGLGKDIAIQRQQHTLVMRKKLNQMVDPNEFLENDTVKVTSYISI